MSASAARSASMMNCSVWLLISNVLNAATVTSVIAPSSAPVSFLMTIFRLMKGEEGRCFLVAEKSFHKRRATPSPHMIRLTPASGYF